MSNRKIHQAALVWHEHKAFLLLRRVLELILLLIAELHRPSMRVTFVRAGLRAHPARVIN